MTPQLQQAIGFLQLSNLKLSNYVENVIEKTLFLNEMTSLKNLTKKLFFQNTHIPLIAPKSLVLEKNSLNRNGRSNFGGQKTQKIKSHLNFFCLPYYLKNWSAHFIQSNFFKASKNFASINYQLINWVFLSYTHVKRKEDLA